jgi:hypothetical protein
MHNTSTMSATVGSLNREGADNAFAAASIASVKCRFLLADLIWQSGQKL